MKLHLSKDQEYKLCVLIDEWYMEWKNKITDFSTFHSLGVAKEQLKQIICGERKSITTCEISGIKFDSDGNVIHED